MEFANDFEAVQQNISAVLINTIRVASRLSAEDIAFHRSSSSVFVTTLDQQSSRLITLAERLLRRAVPNFRSALASIDLVDTNWPTIVDAIDNLLERSDTCLDEFSGRFREQSEFQRSNLAAARIRLPTRAQFARGHELRKPQEHFDYLTDNNASPPFRPLLSSKPHAVVSLEQSLGVGDGADGAQHSQHPYEPELVQYDYPSSVYTEAEPIPPIPWDTSNAVFVDDYDSLLGMLDELKTADEIAIDLEHHDTHSYIGLVSLMQISTRQQDWIIDTLKPWRRKLTILNEVFADPKILKVLHGAHMDIVWLQRDLGLYVVGLFDTHHASRVLGYSGGSLAFLLKKFANFDAQKQYQTADWRLRPLPVEMLAYARSDTHFLLYIYDCMRNELLNSSGVQGDGQNLVKDVLEKSTETSLQVYEHPVYDARQGLGRGGWFNLIQRNMTPMSKEQFAVFRGIHQWRDALARQEDESTAIIMANHVLLNVSHALPRDMAGLLRVLHPISHAVRCRAEELLDIIHRMIAAAETEPTLAEKLTEILQAKPEFAKRIGLSSPTAMPGPSMSTPVTTKGVENGLSHNIMSTSSSFWGSIKACSETLPKSISATGWFKPWMTLPVPIFSPETGQISSIGMAGELTAVDVESATASRGDNPNGKRGFESAVNGGADASSVGNVVMRNASEEDITSAAQMAAKRSRKLLRAEARTVKIAGTSNIAVEEQPLRAFDYSAAPSILHPAGIGVAERTSTRPFNPYIKASEAPSGVRKKQESRATKSHTFKK